MQEATAMRAPSAPRNGHVETTWAVIGLRSRRELMWRMVEENAVIVFARRGCCMSHVVKRLLQVVGANPTVYEVEENDVDDVAGELGSQGGGGGERGRLQFPAVFIGGRWFGGLERIISTHITEELTPLLKHAGALWL